MKASEPFIKLVVLSKVSTIDFAPLEKLPVNFGKYPKSVWDIPFEDFIFASKYQTLLGSCNLLFHVTGKNDIAKYSIQKIYPLWYFYQKEITNIVEGFVKANDEIPKGKRSLKKDLAAYGFLNVVDFIAGGRVEQHDLILKKSVEWVFVRYKMKTEQLINEIASYDIKN